MVADITGSVTCALKSNGAAPYTAQAAGGQARFCQRTVTKPLNALMPREIFAADTKPSHCPSINARQLQSHHGRLNGEKDPDMRALSPRLIGGARRWRDASRPTLAACARRRSMRSRRTTERLEATVDYLKANATAEHKEAAVAAVDRRYAEVDRVDKFTWSGDFRFRHEIASAAHRTTTTPDALARSRSAALRFGVAAKVNDTVNAKSSSRPSTRATTARVRPTRPRATPGTARRSASTSPMWTGSRQPCSTCSSARSPALGRAPRATSGTAT